MKIGIINSNTGNVENVIKSIKYLGFEPIMIEERPTFKIIPFNNTRGWIFSKNDGFFKKSKIDEILTNYADHNLK